MDKGSYMGPQQIDKRIPKRGPNAAYAKTILYILFKRFLLDCIVRIPGN